MVLRGIEIDMVVLGGGGGNGGRIFLQKARPL